MNNGGIGPSLSCGHQTHSDQQLLDCLARSWRLSVPQLVATLAALVFAHTEREATEHTTRTTQSRHVTRPPRLCDWCQNELPAGTHHKRRYCPDTDCRRLANNERHSAGRPTRKQSP